MRKTVYIGFAFKHHQGTHGGYHHLADYMNYDYEVDIQSWFDRCSMPSKNILIRIARRLCSEVFGKPVPPVYLLRLIWLGLRHNNLVYHFVYGENSFFNISPFIRKGNKLVCTFHQPVEWFKNNNWGEKIRCLDKVILVGDSETDKFMEMSGKDNVIFIPHGISTNFYHPYDSVKKEHLLLTVGNWLRDYSFADRVYQRMLDEDQELRIVVVANKESTKCLTPNERLQILSGITDEELRDLYLRSSLLFLPLLRYTANNSLLEASACGCNILIASDFKDNSYIPADLITTCGLHEEEAIIAIKKSFSTRYNTKLSEFVSEAYSWEKIAQRISNEFRN